MEATDIETSNSNLLALQNFLLENPELEALERQIAPFNIFEALGAVRDELRHSDFLAFLLNPSQSHGLRDSFVKRFLQLALAGGQLAQASVRPIDIALWDLDSLEVRREWQSIDLLLLDETNKLVVIIENKILSGEHSDQLKRYWRLVEQNFPRYHQLGIFLTPEGRATKDDAQYLALSYNDLHQDLQALLSTQGESLHPDVHTAISHYTRMIRRHIVSESEIADLCRKIYRKHKTALDLIYEYRADQQSALHDFLKELVSNDPDFQFNGSRKTEIRFTPTVWTVPSLRTTEGWGYILTMYFQNVPDRVTLYVTIAPGADEPRLKLLHMARDHKPLFNAGFSSNLLYKWNTIYKRNLLTPKDLTDADDENLKTRLNQEWQSFKAGHFQQLLEVVKQQEWIWQNVDTSITG